MKYLILFILCLFSHISLAQEAPAINALATATEDVETFDDKEFKEWVEDFKKTAVKKYKIKQSIVDEAFRDIKYEPKIINYDRKQPEFMKTFWNYYDSALKPERVANGKIKLKQNAKLFYSVAEKYNVQPQILIAFWGMETNYGKYMGKHSIIPALITLAFDPRRSDFFTSELIKALQIVNAGHISIKSLKGSWAGAFGNFQFMPSTFMAYAVDGNGDGKIDLINNLEDAVNSAANYLSKMGWNGKYKWGRPVLVDKKDKNVWQYVNSNEWKDVNFFKSLGVKKYDGSPLPSSDISASLIAPDGVNGPVFLVYNNFKYIMRWNFSTNYALSIGLLSDAIVSNSTPLFDRPANWDKIKPMSTNQIKEIQEKLAKLDIYNAKVSGLYGKLTMKAIKKYQNMLLDGDKDVSPTGEEITTYKSGNPIIPDGYPSFDLYEMLIDKK